MKRVLILGGSGFVGRSLIAQLQREGGWRITVPTRRLAHARALMTAPEVRLVESRVSRPGELEQLLTGQDLVINLIAILQGSAAAFEQAHVDLPRRLAAACQAQGVQRLIHVSALGVGADAPSLYLSSKATGEAVLADSGLSVSILRPSVIFGREDRFLNLFAGLQAALPLLPLAGASAQFQPVWVEDVAAAIHRTLSQQPKGAETYELAGPRAAPLAHWVRLAGRFSGHQRPILPLPGALAWLQALLMEALPGEPLMSRDNLRSMRVPNIATGRWPGLADLGITAQSVETVLPGYMSRLSPLDQWRARAGR